MTSVYGVTMVGAKKQIQKQLKEKKVFKDPTVLHKAALYLTKLTIDSIGDLFKVSISMNLNTILLRMRIK